jgi:hypothetical protein
MTGALLVAIYVLGVAQGETQTYRNDALRLSLTYPSGWKLAAKKDDARFSIPLTSTQGEATFEVFAVRYGHEPEVWQLVQLQADRQLKRETLKQWQEEILGVPLLLTKSQDTSGPGQRVMLAGLIYSATPFKLNFRLTAPAAGYEEAEFALRKVLESLRTTDGSLPEREDPAKPSGSKGAGGASGDRPSKPPKVVVLGPAPGDRAPRKGEKSVTAKTAGRTLTLRFPEGWKAEAKADATFALTAEAVPGAVTVTLSATIDSMPPGRAYTVAMMETLKSFEAVSEREEALPKFNAAGDKLVYVWREGTGGGDLAALDAVGGTNEIYWTARWALAGSKPPPDVKKRLLALIDRMSVETAP